jgi:hypothetical protein
VNSFKRKIILIGSVLLVLSALVSSYSYYKLNSIYGLIERNKIFEIPFSQSLSELKANFESYRFEVNKIVSAPTTYSAEDIKNSIFKTQTENQILKIQRMAANYDMYSQKVEEADKAFKNYVVAAAAIVDAFSSSADMDSQKEENIKSFSEIMKNNDAAFTTALSELDNQVQQNMVLGTTVVRSYFANAGFWILMLFIFMFLSFCALYIYVSRVSNFVKAVNTSLEDIRDGHYNAEEISQNIPFASEMEFFELADKVTRLSSLIYNDVTLNKENISKLENEVLKLKTVTTYTTAILNSLDMGIMVTDSLLKVSFVNYEFEKFWRIKRNHVVDTVVEDLPFIRLIDGWKDALKSGKTSCFKSKYKLAGKKSKDVDFCVMPLKDANGKASIGTITITRPTEASVK